MLVEKKACNNSCMLQNYIVASPRFPSTQKCYVPPCVAIVPPHVLNKLRCIIIQERGSANKLPSVAPLLNMDNMFYHPILVPFTLEGYLVKVARRIHELWKRLLHPKLMEDTRWMMPLHYPKIYQWHLGPPNMLADNAIRKQGAQNMRVLLSYNLHKWTTEIK